MESKPKVIVYRGWDDQGKYTWSPFVTKLEARFRFSGVSYETKAGSTLKAPKGKIPYVEIQQPSHSSPTFLGDSTLIPKHMVESDLLPDITANISPTARAQDLAIRALLEEKLYFYHGWEKWTQNYYTMRDHILSTLPYPMRVIVGHMIYRKTVQNLYGQGTGRHTAQEIGEFRREIWDALDSLLTSAKTTANASSGHQPFWVLGGDQPTEADTSLFGFLTAALIGTANPDTQQELRNYPVMLDYAGRIHDEYFPDYEKWS